MSFFERIENKIKDLKMSVKMICCLLSLVCRCHYFWCSGQFQADLRANGRHQSDFCDDDGDHGGDGVVVVSSQSYDYDSSCVYDDDELVVCRQVYGLLEAYRQGGKA